MADDTFTDDDIPEPETPAPVLAAIAAEQEPHAGFDLSRLADQCLLSVHESMHALTEEMRATVAQCLPAPVLPEEAHITALSPRGFRVTLITRKSTPGALIEAVGKMEDWLHASGYAVPEVPF